MNNKNDKSDIYELVLEKLILRKMREQNEQVSKSLDTLNQIIQSSVLSASKSSNSKRNVNGNGKSIINAMEKKYSKYSSLEDFYGNMRLEDASMDAPVLYENHTYSTMPIPMRSRTNDGSDSN